MSEQDNIRVVQEAYAAFQRGDIQGVLDRLTDDAEWVTPGPPDVLPHAGSRRGHNEVEAFFTALGESEEVEMFEPREFIAQGDRVVALVNYRTRVKSTGRTAEDELVHIFTLRDGRIARFREYYDTTRAVEAYRPAASQASTGFRD